MNQTLLIAEGDAELCDVYRRFFARQGFDVETASDALDCVEKLRRVPPAVLVLDWELRWGGGDGVLAWLTPCASFTRRVCPVAWANGRRGR
jgi:DNA-binding response OmpR family regulator